MILSTTPTIEGHPIREYRGVVTGETIIGTNFVKDFFASVRDVIGGRSGSYESTLRQAKNTALREMADRGRAGGSSPPTAVPVTRWPPAAQAGQPFS